MNRLLQAALEYQERGWSVIPVQPSLKKPMIPWAQYQHERADQNQIRIWWERWPDANVGIVTGRVSSLVAIDIDKEPVDQDLLAILAATTQESRTGSGGRHLIYGTQADIPNRVALRPGVDVRGEGGFIVVPPSRHSSGISYRWVSNNGPTPLPSDLQGLLCAEAYAGVTVPDGDAPQRWLYHALGGVAAGERNGTCARMAGYYLGKGIPKDVVLATLYAWNSKNRPPLPETEVLRTLESVAARAPVLVAKTGETPAFPLIGFSQFMSDFGDVETRWLIKGWLPEATIAFAVAPPGTFKTWMLFDAAVSIASGTSFLGKHPVTHPGPVIVIQQEDFRGTMAERFALVVNSRFKVTPTDGVISMPPNLPIHMHLDRELRFSNKASIAGLRQQIIKIRPRLVILDPLYSAASTDDYMSRTAEQMLELKGMRDEFGCSFLIAHHTKKRSGDDTGREGLWGSQFLNALLETGWQIRANQGGVIVRRHFKSSKEVETVRLNFEISDTPPYRYAVAEVTANSEDALGVGDRILAVLPATAAQVSERLGIHRTTITRRLKALVADKTITRNGKGIYSLVDELL